MDTKLLVCEAIEDFVKTNPHCRNSEIVRGVLVSVPSVPENLVERMIKAMTGDGLLKASPWQIPMRLGIRVVYSWNYSGIKRIHVPAAKTRMPASTKVTEEPVPPMAWMIYQLQQKPGERKYAH